MAEEFDNEVKEEKQYVLPGGEGGNDKSVFGIWESIQNHLTPEYYWSYQGGHIDNFLSGYIRFGGFISLVFRTILQNILVYLWITFIAPLSGYVTWQKAVKNDKVLYIETKL